MVKQAFAAGFVMMVAMAPVAGYAQGATDCTFPGIGWGVGGTPGQDGTPGQFPGGGATGGTFPGGNCGGVPGNGIGNGGGPTVQATEPFMLLAAGAGLLGALRLRRR